MTTPRVSESVPAELRKKYRVIAKLGEGGMAHIHLAVALGVGGVRKLVVLKSMRPELAAESRMREMFLTEARLAATLNHPNIVQTFEVAVFGGRPVLVMEYMDGQSLSSILHRDRRGRVPLPVQLHVLKEVLNGLDYLHGLADLDGTPLNLVHRDISPPNIFVTYDGRVKILDFGIAKNIREAGNTEIGVIKGKIRYMAPEQFQGVVDLDRRADIFSVGVLLWEALTGKRLWEGCQDVQIMGKLIEGEMPAPSEVARKVPPSLESICRKALSRECGDRYESADAMQVALEAAIAELGLGANHRQVGKLMSELFEERRSRTKSLLEAQLREEEPSAVSIVISDESDADFTDEAAVGAELWGLPAASTAPPPSLEKRGLRKLVPLASLATIALAACIVAVAALARSRHLQTMIHAPPATTAEAPARPTSEAPGSVRVSVQATPARAKLFFDDVPLEGNPFHGEFPSDSRQHSVRAEARGFRPQTLPVTLSAPLALSLDLQPAAVAPYSPERAAATRGAPPLAPAESEAPAPAARSCNPPYYFDQKGIKSYRPECLK